MYPKRPSNQPIKNKPTFLPTDQQASRVQKIIENAKKFSGEGKKDYMMEGLKNIKKKPQLNPQTKKTDIYYQQADERNRRSSRQSEVSNRRSEASSKQKELAKNSFGKMGKNTGESDLLKKQTSEAALHQNMKQMRENARSLDKKQRGFQSKGLNLKYFGKEEKNQILSDRHEGNLKKEQFMERVEKKQQRKIQQNKFQREKKNIYEKEQREKVKFQTVVKGEEVKADLVAQSERELALRTEERLKDLLSKSEREKGELADKYYKIQTEKHQFTERLQNYEKEVNFLRKENKELQLIQADLMMENKRGHSEKNSIEAELKGKEKRNEGIVGELSEKCNYLTVEMKKKDIEYKNLERRFAEYEFLLKDRDKQIEYYCDKIQKKQKEVQEKMMGKEAEKSKNQKTNEMRIENLEKQLSTKRQMQEQYKRIKKQKLRTVQLQAEIQKFEKQLSHKNRQISQLQTENKQFQRIIHQLKNTGNKDNYVEVTSLQNELKALYKQKNQIASQYEQKLLRKDEQIQNLHAELLRKQYEGNKHDFQIDPQEGTFERVIDGQVQQMNQLRQINTEKIEEIFRIKTELEKSQTQIMNLASQNKLVNAKLMALQKNKNRTSQAELKMLHQQVESSKRRIETLEQTLESKKVQIREKDLFIQNNMSRMSNKEDLPMLLAQLQKILNK